MSTRWPLHPTPLTGEALSSWLSRIAKALHVEDDDLVHDLGYHLPDWHGIDLSPPSGFVDRVSRRTGVPTNRVRVMSLDGYCPWLMEDLQPISDGFTTYTRQMSVLFHPGRRRDRDAPAWRAWSPVDGSPRRRVCPRCVPDTEPPHPYQLMWSIPLMLTCPVHHYRLESYPGSPGWYFDVRREPAPASRAVEVMDGWTWQALSTGQVDLPQRRVHVGVWFRLLATLLDELGATLSELGAAGPVSGRVWERAGHRPRAGQSRWHPYEDLPPEAQDQTLEAAATAIQMIRHGVINPRGEDAALFLPEPHTALSPGRQRLKPHSDVPTTQELWWQMNGDLVQWVEAARRDPQAAQRLFALVTVGRHYTTYYSQMCDMFTKLGIPIEYVTGNYPRRGSQDIE